MLKSNPGLEEHRNPGFFQYSCLAKAAEQPLNGLQEPSSY